MWDPVGKGFHQLTSSLVRIFTQGRVTGSGFRDLTSRDLFVFGTDVTPKTLDSERWAVCCCVRDHVRFPTLAVAVNEHSKTRGVEWT